MILRNSPIHTPSRGGSANGRLSGRRAQAATAAARSAAQPRPLMPMPVRLFTTVSRSTTSSRSSKAVDYRGTSNFRA